MFLKNICFWLAQAPGRRGTRRHRAQPMVEQRSRVGGAGLGCPIRDDLGVIRRLKIMVFRVLRKSEGEEANEICKSFANPRRNLQTRNEICKSFANTEWPVFGEFGGNSMEIQWVCGRNSMKIQRKFKNRNLQIRTGTEGTCTKTKRFAGKTKPGAAKPKGCFKAKPL